jgi:carbon monoxide dehydrogenase subunit G
MELTTNEDIEAPLEAVFATVADFDVLERSALRRGVDVRRTDQMYDHGPGMTWATSFAFRGKTRTATIELIRYEPSELMSFTGVSGGLEVDMTINLVALSRSRTRLSITVEMRPRTLSARLLMQSIKLAKANVVKRFRVRIADYAKDIEDRAKRLA